MLEEALKNESVCSLETMRSVGYFLQTDFVQGGTNTEARFLRWFPLLVPKMTLYYPVLSPTQPHSLWKAMEREMAHRPHLRFTVPFQLLPPSLCHAWLHHHTTSSSSNSNASKLVQQWTRETDQTELQRYLHRHWIWMQQQQQSAGGMTPTKSPPPPVRLDQAPVKLTIMEYFLLYFVRYATLPHKTFQHKDLYICLLQEYLNTNQAPLLTRIILEYWMHPPPTADLLSSNANASPPSFTPLLKLGLKQTVRHIVTRPDRSLLKEWQQPFFQYLQTGFTNPNSPFLYLLQLWLLYIQPWKQPQTKPSANHPHGTRYGYGYGWNENTSVAERTMRNFSPVAKELLRTVRPNTSKYTHEWKWFVDQNEQIYTVIFGLFVRRARELDNFSILFQVWNVFLPLPLHHPDNHWKQDCLPDMKYLLEEMHHQRKQQKQQHPSLWFTPQIITNIDSKFQQCMTQAKQILSWDETDFQHWYQTQLDPPLSSTHSATTTTKEPERYANQNLTEKGRQQLIEGTYTPLQIASLVTQSKSQPQTIQTYEVESLVHFWTLISSHLNSTHLLQTIHLQINLRFLADSRNFLFISIICLYIYARLTW